MDWGGYTMERLTKKECLWVSLMVFSLFFGAGNLIFPPFLGQTAGTQLWPALGGFIVSAVGLPILGVVAVAKSGGLQSLAKRVHPVFALVFTLLVYLSIGPLLGIPRNGGLAFEMGISPYLPSAWLESGMALFIYSLVYFAVAFWLCLSPAKLSDRLGKLLTPLLLLLLGVIFACSLVNPLGSFGSPVGGYVTGPFFKGFLDGYMTMDTIAALNFGIVIVMALKQKGVKGEKALITYTIYAGVFAGVLLAGIYVLLGYLGASGASLAAGASNGADTLTHVVLHLFGTSGIVLLGLVFTLACLSTSVGLITSCSQYFSSLTPHISYKGWVAILSSVSMLFANLGLDGILAVSVPILSAIYPMAITLIALALTDRWFHGRRMVYVGAMVCAGVVSVVDACVQADLFSGRLVGWLSLLPLYEEGLGWTVPALVGAAIGLALAVMVESRAVRRTQINQPS